MPVIETHRITIYLALVHIDTALPNCLPPSPTVVEEYSVEEPLVFVTAAFAVMEEHSSVSDILEMSR